ncbi:MAG: M3 family metallopeptidase [Candidatus Paceibacterota bacterium]|jgi:oligopeptidase A
MKRIIVAILFAIIVVAGVPAIAQTNAPPKTELVLYQWDKISVLTAKPKLDVMLAKNRAWIKSRLTAGAPYTWENLVLPINAMDDEMHRFWWPIVHMSEVAMPEKSIAEKTEKEFAKCQEMISRFDMENLQNKALYDAYRAVAKENLPSEQKMAVENTLRAYRLFGIELSAKKKVRLTKIISEENKLGKMYTDNIVKSTDSWKKRVTDESVLDGMPDAVKNAAKKNAEALKLNGFVLNLKEDTWVTVLTTAKNRELRREVLQAASSVATAKGPGGKQFDNIPIVKKIIHLRFQKAKLLGFKNYAEMALATRMAPDTDTVMNFLNDLRMKSFPFAQQEFRELSDYAHAKDGIAKLEPWDTAYYSQLLEKEKFSFSGEDFRPYFPLEKVIGGLEKVANKLYGILLVERKDVSVWSPDVKFYEVRSDKGELRGGLYMDLFGREGKMSGGWANSAVVRYQRSDGAIQLPVGLIVLNFRPPQANEEALLSLDDVTAFFHEFGHNLQIILTQANVRDVAGLNGVPWDGIELASQFMENFVWQPEVLDIFAAHYKTGEKLPADLLAKASEMRRFEKGIYISRQLVQSKFDFRLHMEYDPSQKDQLWKIYSESYNEASLTAMYPWMTRAITSFPHIFAGGYSAGYYSYIWSEVLSADDFSPFIKNGKIDWTVGKKFEGEVLSRGGSRPFMESNAAFLGRKPSVDALMKQYGFDEVYKVKSPHLR